MLETILPKFNASVLIIISISLCACSTEDAKWQVVSPSTVGMDEQKLKAARDYALQGEGSGLIMRSGKVVAKWGDESKLYDLKSSTKSIGISALGLAMLDKKVDLDDLLAEKLSELKTVTLVAENHEWLDKITLRQIAEQTAGFDKRDGFCAHFFEPGTAWAYSDCGPNWLGDYLTVLFGKGLNELLQERVFRKIGILKSDLQWRTHAYQEPELRGIPRQELGGGISANIRAMALIGQLYLNRGTWEGEQILPAKFVDLASKPNPENTDLSVVSKNKKFFYANGPRHYGLLWWNNYDGALPAVPRDAFWSWGLHDSHIVAIPSLDIVAVRAGKDWPGPRSSDNYGVLSGFLNPIVESVNRGAPYPNSTLITGIQWNNKVFRAAEGSDNWPVTWGKDGSLYTAYGDGWGFKPKVAGKLSLGIARVEGQHGQISGSNIRSSSVEQLGDSKAGKKASGMLMVGDILYMWVRNANNKGQQCQLAWSADQGKTWEWSPWKHTDLGYCVFLNFGKNYADARDEYVYTYSSDSDSAYIPSDHVVLARVHKQKIRLLTEYEYFAGLDQQGEPKWSHSFDNRKPVFTFKDGCNRLDVVHNRGLGRYLMTMRNVGQTAWKPGGVNHWSMYEAPEPWGPWATVFYTEKWDIDAGESLRIPSKWIASNGTALSLVFSGDDSFSVRRGELKLRK